MNISIYVCVSHSNGIIVIQSGGRASSEEEKEEKEAMAHGDKIHWAGEVALVNKNMYL